MKHTAIIAIPKEEDDSDITIPLPAEKQSFRIQSSNPKVKLKEDTLLLEEKKEEEDEVAIKRPTPTSTVH